VNKLALGTVQFGLDYGVTNSSGKATISEVRSILNFAKKNGVDTLDTAPIYGNSEQVLGRIGVNDFNVITKTTELNNSVENVIDHFQKSLKNLHQNQIKGLLIHNFSDIKNNQFDTLFNKLYELKKEGVVRKIGFSTYSPNQIDFLLANFDFDLIQLPCNVFDSRLIEGGQLKLLKNKGVEIHARSVFLQGILLDFDKLSDYFLTWREKFEDYQSVVRESNLTLLEYSIKFVLGIPEIDKVLVGVNSESQLKEVVHAAKEKSNLKAYTINDINLLNPSLWKV